MGGSNQGAIDSSNGAFSNASALTSSLECGMHGGVLLWGVLEKKRDGALRGGWAKRRFLLTQKALHYYRQVTDLDFLGEERDHINLCDITYVGGKKEDQVPPTVVDVGTEHYYLEIIARGRLFLMRTPLSMASTCHSWVKAIQTQKQALLSLQEPPKSIKTSAVDIGQQQQHQHPLLHSPLGSPSSFGRQLMLHPPEILCISIESTEDNHHQETKTKQDQEVDDDADDDDDEDEEDQPERRHERKEIDGDDDDGEPTEQERLDGNGNDSTRRRRRPPPSRRRRLRRVERIVAWLPVWGAPVAAGVIPEGGACSIALGGGGVARVGTQALLSSWAGGAPVTVDVVGGGGGGGVSQQGTARYPYAQVLVSATCHRECVAHEDEKPVSQASLSYSSSQVIENQPIHQRQRRPFANVLASKYPIEGILALLEDGAALAFLLMCFFIHVIQGIEAFPWMHKVCLTIGAALAFTTMLNTSSSRFKRSHHKKDHASTTLALHTMRYEIVVHECRFRIGEQSYTYPNKGLH